MDWKKLIGDALRALEEKKSKRDAADKEMRGIVAGLTDGASLTAEQREKVAELSTEKRSLVEQIAADEAQVAKWREMQAEDERQDKLSEERQQLDNKPKDGTFRTQDRDRTYNARNQDVFMRDLMRYSFGGIDGSTAERLEKHEKEARAAGQFSERAASTSTFAGIIPPQYLIDQYALVARAGRPTANVVQHFDLPAEGMSLIIPRGTTGVTTGVQATENSALANQDQAWSNVTVPVVTVGGYNDVSRQSVERAAGTDQIVFNDLLASLAVNVDQQVLSGTGSSGQALGILATAGINQATAFGAAATPATFYTKLAGQLSAVETTRYFAPNVIIMHPRRWNWLVGQTDSSQRPLVVPNANGPLNALGVADVPQDTPSSVPVGSIMGLPVITDASIPTAVGTGPEDQVIVARREDLLLWEDPTAPFTLKFEQPVGQQLTVRLVAYAYIAFTAGRFPTAVGVVGGNAAAGFGLVAPTF